ncbi:homocysteine S-methyltransferase [Lactobacillus sp. ESL0791]|uniref:homocysteine S-methyltransferase n=1 Tax=Lactobacillus sp. ESL0791 TaxID=2983234 RepID=UPI0023F9510F|nr:homocysteine S-methyltransferase [Lactobacillus sp. ESL0791]MDF7637977.1 homocysteine S-methyltransferase [Lactobacillus sp. ESL0791]
MNLIEAIKNRGLVLDGAMSDELERQGIKTNNHLWTASALITDPKTVYQAHMNYFQAGAQLVITDTYQANVPAFTELGYSNAQAQNFIASAVKIAKQAREDYEKQTGKHNFVAGTIGAYGAYLADGNEYRGDYHLSSKEYLDFHLPRLTTIIAEKPDCLAIETQPKLEEVICLLTWLKEQQPQIPVYVSFTLQDSQTISDGTSLKTAVNAVNNFPQVFAVGVNCVNPHLVSSAITCIQQETSKEIVVYPNQGASYDPASKTWQKIAHPIDFYQATKKWYKLGAHLIGSCCTTGPAQTKEIAQAFEEIVK